ncbi:MAG: PIN domain-containing protein [Solirubrobacterales bacterium]
MTAALDAWAVIALLNDEPGAGVVEATVDGERTVASWINLGEAIYNLGREEHLEEAISSVVVLAASLETEDADESLVIAAARLKATERLSYADAFAVATAERHSARLLTGDPEIISLDRRGLELVDLRSET